MKVNELIITISGPHGTGKSVYSREIAARFGLKRLSAGEIFRRMAEEKGLSLEEFSEIALRDKEVDLKIDNLIVSEARKGGIVVDSLLSGWLLRDIAHIRIYLTAPFKERVKRIAKRDCKSFEEALKETMIREKSEKKRFKEYYGVDLEDLSAYNFIIDTTLGSVEVIKEILFKLIEGYLKTH